MNREKWKRAVAIGGAIDLLVIVGFIAIMVVASTQPEKHEPIKNAYWPFTVETSIYDRPVLETVSQVRQARMTGISEFDFDGEHYVIDGLPKEYVDYSSEYCRMP